jgi:hypothetical protein
LSSDVIGTLTGLVFVNAFFCTVVSMSSAARSSGSWGFDGVALSGASSTAAEAEAEAEAGPAVSGNMPLPPAQSLESTSTCEMHRTRRIVTTRHDNDMTVHDNYHDLGSCRL